ncbi:RICIN domain-containing protein [Streptomyces sp. NPDC058471]|uniref:RICIN domain-containing protein n=1 Tax=Streptomyces sp. NPDC058471 TaxID=3346516 RepID=UPI0036462DD2
MGARLAAALAATALITGLASGSHTAAPAPDGAAAVKPVVSGVTTPTKQGPSSPSVAVPGTYRWYPEHARGTCITAHGGVARHAKIDQYRCVNGAGNQRWYVEAVNASMMTKIHPAGNMNLCVDIPGGSYNQGTQPVLWNCNGRVNQQFLLLCGGNHTHCQVRPAAGSQRHKCLSVQGGSSANNARLILWKCNGAKDQKFTFR